ncbi:MAG: zinc ribbon domain-containing protein [Bacteroidales bacterium]|nr:zinc ribbon domain-containing protein [Bacteroidales bacterium]
MKFCSNCGAQLPDDARFCGACGTPVAAAPVAPAPAPSPAPSPAPAPAPDYAAQADGSVRLCEDGIYRWVYELNMFKSTAILGTLLKIFGAIIAGIWLLIGISSGFDNFGQFTLIMLAVYAGLSVLILISYAIVAAINGGKYCVLFEMSEKDIAHIQLPSQYKKAQVVGWIAAFAGVLAGNMTATAAGILGASRNKLVSSFKNVRSIKPDPAKHIIKVNGTLKANQVYVDDAGFDFVLNFLRSHCPQAN